MSDSREQPKIELGAYFDKDFYMSKYIDVASSGVDPLNHFMEYGWRENRDPSKDFSTSYYMRRYQDTIPANTNPLTHYVNKGRALGFKTMFPEDEVKKYFDSEFYLRRYTDVSSNNKDPFQHYLEYGWKEGRDPSPDFSTEFYLICHRDLIEPDTNPLVHYVEIGKGLGLITKSGEGPAKRFFDDTFYLKYNSSAIPAGQSPFEHYMTTGWKDGRDPSPDFSTMFYLRAHPDVISSGMNPLLHYATIGAKENRLAKFCRPHVEIAPGIDRYSESEIAARFQDMSFPLTCETAKKVMAVIVPEHNEMSGGIYGMFFLADLMKRYKSEHGYEVLLMTNPNESRDTYCRQRNFLNNADVYRFEQIVYCQKAEEIYLHIPEYATAGFLSRCGESTIRYLFDRKKIFINILNQNTMLMPEPDKFSDLRRIADEITQSVAHHAYFGQEFANKYNLPTILFPAYTDLSPYVSSKFANKENIIIYSKDSAAHKENCLKLISSHLPHYRLVEIRSMSFDDYMDLATRCKFSISFGEGFDGYVAQPIYQGGIGITVYNADFFPSSDFLRFPNFFRSPADMLENVVDFIMKLEDDEKGYDGLNQEIVAEWNKLYVYDDIVKKALRLMKRQFDLYPESNPSVA